MSGRLRRGLLALLVAGSVVVPVSAVAPASTPAPAPAAVPALSLASLDARYATQRRAIGEAAELAERYGDGRRAAKLKALGTPERQFLSFDGRGSGRAVEVLGGLRTADRVAVLVPGSDTSLDTFGPSGTAYKTLRGSAQAVHEEMRRSAPRGHSAVVAWLGYQPPRTVSTDVLTTGRADEGASELRRFVGELRAANPSAQVSLLCHSYGSVVCGRAANQAGGLQVANIVLYGSPGTSVDSAAQLQTTARIWAARGAQDWIKNVPNMQLGVLGTTVGFGPDPVSRGFGAQTFDAGDARHSDYHRPGSRSLHNLALIALGRTPKVPHG